MKISAKLLLLLAALAFALALGCSSDDPAGPGPDPDPTGTTALVGDDGSETTDFDSFEQVSMSLADLEANTIYTIEVSDQTKALIGTYELTTDGDGEMDASSVLYDPEPGTYTVDVVDTDISFDITVTAPTAVFYQPCDDLGAHVNNIDVGTALYVSAANGTPNEVVHVYVAPNSYDWEYGTYLYDYTEAVEELTFDAAGEIAPTIIWQSPMLVEGDAAFDLVIDVNRNSIYDAGDYLDGQIGVGFVVQEIDVTKMLIDGHVVERLSSDVHYVYRDLFNVDENVYVYVNPVARMRNLGGNRYVKWVIVPHQATWNDQDPLSPVQTPLGDTVQYGCTNAGRRLVWPAPLTPGQYDVIVDVDGDLLYDKEQDFLDGYSGPGNWVGFTVQEEPETKDWTVLVYADGEGGLSGTRSLYATEIANAMDDDTYAGVLFDGDDGDGFTDCKRYICESGGTVITDQDYGELNMGQALTLYDFLVWGIAKFPADRYMVVLSNHGGSWYNESHPVPNELDYDEPNKAICYDNGDGLNMFELERVFRDVKTLVGDKLDVIWYQGCLMGAVEVASISKDYFDYMVSHETVRYGSENTDKFPNLIAEINGNPNGGTAAEKAVTVERAPISSFAASYDLSEYNDLESEIRSFVDAALTHDDWETFKTEIGAILNTVRRVAPPGGAGLELYMQNGDLIDFFDKIAAATGRAVPESIRDAASDVSFDAAFLVDETAGNNEADEGLFGVAIWLPRSPAEFNNYAAEYSGFDFSTNTRWLEFLAELYGVAYRIELTWGELPYDLDSHFYDASGDPTHHIRWNCKECIDGAALDRDDMGSYGPENVRVSYLTEGPLDHYAYWVYNWSNVVTTEPATVKVFRGSSSQPIKTYTYTYGTEDTWGWHVFNIMTADGSVVDVNTTAPTVPYGVSKGEVTK